MIFLYSSTPEEPTDVKPNERDEHPHRHHHGDDSVCRRFSIIILVAVYFSAAYFFVFCNVVRLKEKFSCLRKRKRNNDEIPRRKSIKSWWCYVKFFFFFEWDLEYEKLTLLIVINPDFIFFFYGFHYVILYLFKIFRLFEYLILSFLTQIESKTTIDR